MRFLLVLCLVFPLMSEAKCTAKDSWHGPDKAEHLVVGSLFGLAGTLGTQDPWKGFGIGAGVGALKEFSDSQGGGTCSAQDFLVTVMGAGIGSFIGGKVLVLPRRDGVQVSYRLEF